MKNLKINVPEGYEIDKEKSTFENIVFKKKNELPRSWKDLRSVYGVCVSTECELIEANLYTDNIGSTNIFKTPQQARASIALAQLSQLRDVYRQGWVPDWNKGYLKYCVIFHGFRFSVEPTYYNGHFLSFEERQTAELFLENFRDLIEQAKPLMS